MFCRLFVKHKHHYVTLQLGASNVSAPINYYTVNADVDKCWLGFEVLRWLIVVNLISSLVDGSVVLPNQTTLLE